MADFYCKNGHLVQKKSDCKSCPICTKTEMKSLFESLSAPCQRALVTNNITSLEKLAQFSEKELLTFHGIGPTSIPKIKLLLSSHHLKLKHGK